MAQRWREESFHRLISGRDQKWRTEPASVRARTADRLGHERKDCAAFLDARDTTSLFLSLCSSQHAVRVAVERGSPYQCACLRQCRRRRARREQMSTTVTRPACNSLPAPLLGQWPLHLVPAECGWRHLGTGTRSGHVAKIFVVSELWHPCDTSPVQQCRRLALLRRNRRSLYS